MHTFLNPRADQARALLAASGLPVEDLQPALFEHFIGLGEGDELGGVVGIELHGPAGLLRSLAVAEGSRGRGFGKRLVAEIEAHAKSEGVREIYLLTTTAAPLFSTLGYSVVARELAPASIRATGEFSSLCPASATFMRKSITP
jgi:amino-acid N-acetyltransferase